MPVSSLSRQFRRSALIQVSFSCAVSIGSARMRLPVAA
jgi:hypothetical protein